MGVRVYNRGIGDAIGGFYEKMLRSVEGFKVVQKAVKHGTGRGGFTVSEDDGLSAVKE